MGVRTADSTAWSRRLVMREPLTSAATFCSSTTFHRMKLRMSGWSRLRITILAARRVVPPDLMAPAARSPIRRNDIRPEDLPPPERGSFSPRRLEKLVPLPEPYLKMRASRVQRSMMPPSLTRSSETDWMKQLWTMTLLERYCPLSVWMSKTGCTPTHSTRTTVSSRSAGSFLPANWSEQAVSSFWRLSSEMKPIRSRKRARDSAWTIETT